MLSACILIQPLIFSKSTINETIVRIKGVIEYFHGEFKIIANQIFLNGES